MDKEEEVATPEADRPIRSLTLQTDDCGYGLVLQGSAPVFVQKVQAGGAAERAGLKEGDSIMCLNGHDTSAADHGTVVNIIHYASGTPLTLKVLSGNAGEMSPNEEEQHLPKTQKRSVQFSSSLREEIPASPLEEGTPESPLVKQREMSSVSSNGRQSPEVHEKQTLPETGTSNPFFAQSEYTNDPNAPVIDTHQALTSHQHQKSSELLADCLSRHLSQIEAHGNDALNPTVKQIGDAVVNAVIENALDIVGQWPEHGQTIDRPSDGIIANGEEMVDATPSETQCDEAIDMVESVDDMPETRKRLRDGRVSEDSENVEQFSSPVKKSKADVFAPSEITESMETETEDGQCVTGTNCSSTDRISVALAVDASTREASLETQSRVENSVDDGNEVAHNSEFGDGTEADVSKDNATRNGITQSLTPSGAAWQWTLSDVGVWLLSIGMGKYQQMFSDVSGLNLLALQKQSLYDRGMTNDADIELVMDAITSLRQSMPGQQVLQTNQAKNRKHSQPPSVYDWRKLDVDNWLQRLGEQYATHCSPAFKEHEINGHVLLRLTDSSLERIGIHNPFIRKSLLQHITLIKFRQEELELRKLLSDN